MDTGANLTNRSLDDDDDDDDDSEPAVVHLSRSEDRGVWVLELNNGEDNRFTPRFFAQFNAALDAVEQASPDGPAALVIKGPRPGTSKFFSNGFDVAWLTDAATQGDALRSLHALLVRLLSFCAPTVCCVTGHAFAGGAMLALACDARVMNGDRGYLCTNELDLGLPFTDGMMALFHLKVPPAARAPLLLFGERLTAKRAVSLGLVDAALPAGELEAAALALAQRQAPKGAKKALYRSTKEQLFGQLADNGAGAGAGAGAGGGGGGPLGVLRAQAAEGEPPPLPPFAKL